MINFRFFDDIWTACSDSMLTFFEVWRERERGEGGR
jgi:hypothetical protein